ncbi:ubiquitin carboxyl-terminal hydrolase [Pseudoalteromonas luteoviolacea]|uniref:USP domain-containing protein n=1 Tax=Pseudoalteromonas luteoviolacea NCIMB 1942 TaxID=1365253 RepID=A0A167G275_9GAMM|nr:ubiquitin carboxyl-terminal hydrolase family protein [Pseudoalteromonas luteoviolacea]KZN53966.1 hypothetical protein N482_24755 [Pseudoalteromonas luteoviolacea NCIMB 1942]KZX01388.1 hypothetical protein JL49_06000 [Pseudoalteromonas luteoviolacea]
MQLTIKNVISLLEYVTSEQSEALFSSAEYLLQNPPIDEKQIKIICEAAESLASNLEPINDKGKYKKRFAEEVSKSLRQVQDEWFKQLEKSAFSPLKVKIQNTLNESIKNLEENVHKLDPDFEKTIYSKFIEGCRNYELKTKFNELTLNFCTSFNKEVANLIKKTPMQQVKFELQKEEPTNAFSDKLELLAQQEKTQNRNKLAQYGSVLLKALGTTATPLYYAGSSLNDVNWQGTAKYNSEFLAVTGGSLLCYGVGWITSFWTERGPKNCQELQAVYSAYEKCKPLFNTEDDREILNILRNKNFPQHIKEDNIYKIGLAQVILSNQPTSQFIKALNVKLVALEQRIWNLLVQPAVNWDAQHRETLQQLMGIILYIEQTNRELSVISLDKSDTYQGKDAWWKIFSTVGVLAPGLMMKLGALNYLSHWFGSSTSIAASVGSEIMKVIGFQHGKVDYADIEGSKLSMDISTNSTNNNETVTGIMLTSGLAIEALSMVVATRISYMNYTSATDALKKMIQEAESTATHVVDRCTRLIGDRLNHIDRSLALMDKSGLDAYKKNAFSLPSSRKKLLDAYQNVAASLTALRDDDILKSGLVNLGNSCYLNSCVQLMQCIDSDVNSSKDESQQSNLNINTAMAQLHEQIRLSKHWPDKTQQDAWEVLDLLLSALQMPVNFLASVDAAQDDGANLHEHRVLQLDFTEDAELEAQLKSQYRGRTEKSKDKKIILDLNKYLIVAVKHIHDSNLQPLQEVVIKDKKDVQSDINISSDKKLINQDSSIKVIKHEVTLAASLTVPTAAGDINCDLLAVICREGNESEHGHYLCYFKKDGVWYEASDQDIKKATIDTFTDDSDFKKNAYLALYKKLEK